MTKAGMTVCKMATLTFSTLCNAALCTLTVHMSDQMEKEEKTTFSARIAPKESLARESSEQTWAAISLLCESTWEIWPRYSFQLVSDKV